MTLYLFRRLVNNLKNYFEMEKVGDLVNKTHKITLYVQEEYEKGQDVVMNVREIIESVIKLIK